MPKTDEKTLRNKASAIKQKENKVRKQKSRASGSVHQAKLERGKIKGTHHWIMDEAGNKFLAPKGTNPDNLDREIYPVSEVTKHNILKAIVEGKTLEEICTKEDWCPPRHVIARWRRADEDFESAIQQARQHQAEYFADKMVEVAEDPHGTALSVKRDKLRLDAYKWLAERYNSEKYAPKTKVEASVSVHTLVVDTGVRMDEPIEIETQEVKQIESQNKTTKKRRTRKKTRDDDDEDDD